MQLTLDFEKKLEDFHLRVHYEGEASRIGILGASGCGKSMTLRSIAGIETPDRGLIRLGSRELFDSSQKINLRPQERRVGYLFQNYALFPTMTVEQNIMAGVRGSKEEQRKRAQEMVRAFQLEGLEKRRPAELSGGQQQRVALARIMAYRPMALLLDEPFSAMDYFLKEKLRLEMKQDHLLLMHEGSIIAGGPTKEIFDHPGTVEAARLTGCKNISRIHQVGPHRICALDWDNLELTTQEEVTDEITHAGIRAHDFFPCASETAENRIPAENPALTELPFEWYIVLQNKIWWKVPKDIRSHDCSDCLPEALCVDPAAIMLLRRE